MEINDSAGKYIIFRDELIEKDAINERLSQEEAKAGRYTPVYEVIRIIGGKPLYLREHFERLIRSVAFVGEYKLLSEDEFVQHTKMLANINGIQNGNVKFLYFLGENNDNVPPFIMYNSVTFYPSDEVFETGVATACITVERPNPNAKIRRESYLKTIEEFKKNYPIELYEPLIVNNAGQITEGSKSNVFFVKGNKVITTPDDMVLKGVMRNRVILLCGKNGIEVEYRAIGEEETVGMDGAFLTGTSIKVLPIKSIGEKQLESAQNPTIRKLMNALNKDIEQDLKRFEE